MILRLHRMIVRAKGTYRVRILFMQMLTAKNLQKLLKEDDLEVLKKGGFDFNRFAVV